MGCGQGWRLVSTCHTFECDVVADDVEVGVQAEVEVADCARLSRCGSSAVDDLIRGGSDGEGGSEMER